MSFQCFPLNVEYINPILVIGENSQLLYFSHLWTDTYSLIFNKMSLEKYGRSTMLVGPWGGQDGLHWNDEVYSTIRQLEIAHGAVINSIMFEYDDNGSSVWSKKNGGIGGFIIDKIRLEFPDEFLTSLHGYYGNLQERGTVIIRSLTFESNKRTYSPYGIEQGAYFIFPPTHGKIVGFLGKSGWCLDSIGVYLQSLHKPTTPADPILLSRPFFTLGTEKYEYSAIHGN